MISVPLKIEIPAITLAGWISILDVAVAAESDAQRPAMAKQLRNLREAIGAAFPPELRVNEERG